MPGWSAAHGHWVVACCGVCEAFVQQVGVAIQRDHRVRNADTGEPPTISRASRHNAKLTRNKNTARSYGTAVAAAPKPSPKHRIGISDPFKVSAAGDRRGF